MDKENEGSKTIKLCVYFHTSGAGATLEPRVAFKAGWVSMPTNHRHGIKASNVKPIYFGRSQIPLNEAIIKCLKENGIRFVEDGKKLNTASFRKPRKRKTFMIKS